MTANNLVELTIAPRGVEALGVEVEEGRSIPRLFVFPFAANHIRQFESNPFRASAVGDIRNSDCLIGHILFPSVGRATPTVASGTFQATSQRPGGIS